MPSRGRAREALMATALIAWPAAVSGWAQAPTDTVADVQSVNGFSSVVDGQPGPPGELQLQLNVGWMKLSANSGAFNARTRTARIRGIYPQLEYTFSGSSFLRNANFQLAMPIQVADGSLSFGPTFAAWQQRWIANRAALLTVASLLQVQIPTGPNSGELGAALTGIVVKQVGSGNLYWNGSASVGGGGTLERWGLIAGYQLPFSATAGVTAAYVCLSQPGGPVQNVLELSADYTASDLISIGPGLLFGLDRGDLTPRFGAGVRLFFTF